MSIIVFAKKYLPFCLKCTYFFVFYFVILSIIPLYAKKTAYFFELIYTNIYMPLIIL